MIRWLLVLLILINLGIFAWGMQRELGRRVPAPQPESDVPSLQLLEETPRNEAAGESDERTADTAPSSLTEEAESGFPTGEEEPDTDQDVAGIAMDGATSETEEIESPAGESDEETSGVGEEVSENLVPPASAPAEDPEPQPAPEWGLVARCYAIGPFAKRADSEQASDLLAQPAGISEIRQEVAERQIGFWVLIPPLENRDQAIAKVAELKAGGLSDVWRFTRGRLANAISLGLFARQDQAERHRKQVAAKGFPAEVQPRYVEQSVYWLDIDGTGRQFGEETWDGLRAAFPEIEVNQVACP